MPTIKVFGVPPGTPELRKLVGNIRQAVTKVPGLEIPVGEVTVFFPCDRLENGLGEELIAEVSGLFDKPERTSAVKKHLTVGVLNELAAFAESIPQCRFVECYITGLVNPAECSSARLR